MIVFYCLWLSANHLVAYGNRHVWITSKLGITKGVFFILATSLKISLMKNSAKHLSVKLHLFMEHTLLIELFSNIKLVLRI